MVRGTVLETMDAAGYTYTLIQLEDENRWVASQPAKVQVGDVVQTTEGMAMAGFHSKALNRTFDTVYFVETLQNLSSETLPDGHPETALPSGHPDVAEPETTEDVKTAVAQLEPGQDIAWLYANKDSLNGQPIRLRGKVVKYNDGILGQNFIHIQDGSWCSIRTSAPATASRYWWKMPQSRRNRFSIRQAKREPGCDPGLSLLAVGARRALAQ
jgi:hypothetical protein